MDTLFQTIRDEGSPTLLLTGQGKQNRRYSKSSSSQRDLAELGLSIFGLACKESLAVKMQAQAPIQQIWYLHRTFVAHVERQARNISLDNIEKLADALGVEPFELLE